ncbi:hypothetical protein TRVL_04345 [Trypanosoma vivax]|nr:hypothetical protein TRVL_04345 [Trypanosoma vivax]
MEAQSVPALEHKTVGEFMEDEFGLIGEDLLRSVPCAHDVLCPAADLPRETSAEEKAAAEDKGVCAFPPLAKMSFMIRGDNGEVRWVTASGLPSTVVHQEGVEGGLCVRDDDKELAPQDLREKTGGCEEEEDGGLTRCLGLHGRRGVNGLDFVNIAALQETLLNEAAQEAVDSTGNSSTLPCSRPDAGDKSREELLWVVKYTPKRFHELLSDDSTNLKLLRWMKSWDAYVFRNDAATPAEAALMESSGPSPARPDDRLAILVGPPGVGKTTLAHVLASHCGYETIEINASVDRTTSRIESMIQLAVAPCRGRHRVPGPSNPSGGKGTSTLREATQGGASSVSLLDSLLTPKCLIIDEMDGIASNVGAFLLKQDIHCPVICLCNDYYVPALRPLRQQCRFVLHVPPIRPQRLLARLSEIAERENIRASSVALAELVRASNGDVRCCLNTMQFAYQAVDASVASSPKQQHELLRKMYGKDSKLSLWDSWRVVFERQERGKYVQLLRKEFLIDYDAAVMEGCSQLLHGVDDQKPKDPDGSGTQIPTEHRAGEAKVRVAAGFRVDPGYVYTSHVLLQCGETGAMLEGLQEFYLKRPYTDYSLRHTHVVADAFAFHDCLTSAAYRHPSLLPFVDQYAQSVTATRCFCCCSSASRSGGSVIGGFPREGFCANRRKMESTHIVRSLRDGCRVPEISAHLYTADAVNDFIPLLLRCLCDVSVRLPSRPIASIAALNKRDHQLLSESVARHATYGLSYALTTRGLFYSGEESEDEVERWDLTPPIHRTCCVSRSASRAQHEPGHWELSPVMVLSMKAEMKQLMVGEIGRFIIQSEALHNKKGRKDSESATHPSVVVAKSVSDKPLVEHQAPRKRERVDDDGAGGGDEKVEGDIEVTRSVPHRKLAVEVNVSELQNVKDLKDSSVMPNRFSSRTTNKPEGVPVKIEGSVRRDLFGRPIPDKASGVPVVGGSRSLEENGPASSVKTIGVKKAANVQTVQYIYHDGSTNAVKIPASLKDF